MTDPIIFTGDLIVDVGHSAPYGIIYADPPWTGSDNRTIRGSGGRTYYPRISDAQLQAMPVPLLAADNSLLFLWATWPCLPSACALMAAWGFTYITGCPWLKVTKDGRPWPGMGRYFRQCSELLLVGRRGRVEPRPFCPGVILAPRSKLISCKPEQAATICMTYPGPYLELFARRPRPGWVVWGNECSGQIITPDLHIDTEAIPVL